MFTERKRGAAAALPHIYANGQQRVEPERRTVHGKKGYALFSPARGGYIRRDEDGLVTDQYMSEPEPVIIARTMGEIVALVRATWVGVST